MILSTGSPIVQTFDSIWFVSPPRFTHAKSGNPATSGLVTDMRHNSATPLKKQPFKHAAHKTTPNVFGTSKARQNRTCAVVYSVANVSCTQTAPRIIVLKQRLPRCVWRHAASPSLFSIFSCLRGPDFRVIVHGTALPHTIEIVNNNHFALQSSHQKLSDLYQATCVLFSSPYSRPLSPPKPLPPLPFPSVKAKPLLLMPPEYKSYVARRHEFQAVDGVLTCSLGDGRGSVITDAIHARSCTCSTGRHHPLHVHGRGELGRPDVTRSAVRPAPEWLRCRPASQSPERESRTDNGLARPRHESAVYGAYLQGVHRPWTDSSQG